jgi:hypothetical protein
MSSRYVISVENKRGANTNYAIFMEPPQFSGGQQPWMNVWYTSFVPYGGSFEVQTGTDYYHCAWNRLVTYRWLTGVFGKAGFHG